MTDRFALIWSCSCCSEGPSARAVSTTSATRTMTIAARNFPAKGSICLGIRIWDAYCTFSANDTDRLDVKGSERPGRPGALEVIGGSGKWAGARGTGVFTRVGSEGEHNFFNFEIELTTP